MARMQQRQKILVVDDDLRLRDLLKRYLTEQGFAVDTVQDAAAMERQQGRMRYDLMVLDLMLPGEDGLAICRRLRAERSTVPIIMLTAKGDDVDRIVGLEMGADDYLAKPFNPRELVARIHALLRRQAPAPTPGAPSAEPRVVQLGPFQLHLASRAPTTTTRPSPRPGGAAAPSPSTAGGTRWEPPPRLAVVAPLDRSCGRVGRVAGRRPLAAERASDQAASRPGRRPVRRPFEDEKRRA